MTDPIVSNEAGLTPAEGAEAPDAFTAGWADVLDQLPEQARALVIEPLKEHDKKYQELQTNWNKVKDIPDEYRDVERIKTAFQVLDNIEKDPNRVLQVLAENLGVTVGEAKQIVKEAEKQQEQTKLEFDDNDDPRLKTMAQKMAEMEATFNERFQTQTQREEKRLLDQETARQGQLIDQQVSKLISDGKLPNDAVVVRNLMLHADFAQKNGSKDVIGDAYKSLMEYNAKFAPAVKEQNPLVPNNLLFLPTGGAAPPTEAKGPNLDTTDGRLAMMRAIADAAAKQ